MGTSPVSVDSTETNPEGAYVSLLTYAELLQNPELAQLYTAILEHGPATVEQLKERLDVPHSTAYKYANELEEMGVLQRNERETPATLTVDPVRLVFDTESGQIAATPVFVAAIGAQTDREAVELFVDRHGVAKLGAALHYAFRVRRGELTQRTAASRLDVHPVEAMTVFDALQEIIDRAEAFDPYLSAEE
jgi:predicted transcriptional regulator